jgi:hypothetical protein
VPNQHKKIVSFAMFLKSKTKKNNLHRFFATLRRVDIKVVQPRDYGAAVLYYTGPPQFAEQMAATAVENGVALYPWSRAGDEYSQAGEQGQPAVLSEQYVGQLAWIQQDSPLGCLSSWVMQLVLFEVFTNDAVEIPDQTLCYPFEPVYHHACVAGHRNKRAASRLCREVFARLGVPYMDPEDRC